MSTLSVIIITKNEAQKIRQCLEGVKFAQEIIVVDSGSTDKTVAIAKEYTDRVYEQSWQGFGAQKNLALDLANGEWVLSVDADEIVTPELAEEIKLVITSPRFDSYFIP